VGIGADLSARNGADRTRSNGTRLMARPNEDRLDDAEIRRLDAEEQRAVLLSGFGPAMSHLKTTCSS
jgi:hypothetical protein